MGFAGLEVVPDSLAGLGIVNVFVDELVEATGLDEERAKTLIMKARAHWFENESA